MAAGTGPSRSRCSAAPPGPTGPDGDRLSVAVAASVVLSGEVLGAIAPLWADVHLTLPQVRALVLLSRREQLTIGQLGRYLGVGVPAASHLVERLLRRGLVQRRSDAVDRRRVFVELTPEGEAVRTRLPGR